MLPEAIPIQVDGGVGAKNVRELRERGATLFVAGASIFGRDDQPGRVPRARRLGRVSISRAVALAAAADQRAYPKPTVGAVIVRDGEIVGEGVTETTGRHAEVVALDAAGERARGATLYVTLEPCAHHGSTPPCTDAILAAGVERVVFGAHDPNPEAAGGEERLRSQGVDVEFVDSWDARVQNEAWRTWVRERRPFVIYKAADDARRPRRRAGRALGDGRGEPPARARAARPGRRGRRGGGTARADLPRLDARGVETPKGQPRRLVFSAGPAAGRARPGTAPGGLAEELAALAADGVQSLLLEGGPTLASAFLAADLVDKLMLFVAPVLAGDGPSPTASLPSPRTLTHLTARPVGADVLLEAYVHDP